MPRINKVEITNLNNNFKLFRNYISKGGQTKPDYFASQIKQYENKYKKAGLLNNFAETIFVFAKSMEEKGIKELSGIIYSKLMKMPGLNLEAKEKYALQALYYARTQQDSIHVLARLYDLKMLYKETKQQKMFLKTLFLEEQELRKICANFKNTKKKYKTVSRNTGTKVDYKLQLAKTRVDIAKYSMRSNPQIAVAVLRKARNTFVKQNRQKEVEFVDTMLKEIAENNPII